MDNSHIHGCKDVMSTPVMILDTILHNGPTMQNVKSAMATLIRYKLGELDFDIFTNVIIQVMLPIIPIATMTTD